MASSDRRPFCDCGSPVTEFHLNAWVCSRCARIQRERQRREKAPRPKLRTYSASDYGRLTEEGFSVMATL